MANTRTVAASGADHTTIGAALSWLQTNHDFDTDGIATIQITDTSTYYLTSPLTLGGISGTPTSSAYLVLTSDAADPFSGPLIDCDPGSGTGTVKIALDYTYIHNLEFFLSGITTSAEVIRIDGDYDNILISRCVLRGAGGYSDQDGIYTGNNNTTFSVDHCVFANFGRAAINLQGFSGTSAATVYVDHCTLTIRLRINEANGAA